MMTRPWWTYVIQWTLFLGFMWLATNWFYKIQKEKKPRNPGELSHAIPTLIIGGTGALFFGGITLLSNIYPNETVTWWTTSAFLLFALGSFYLVLCFFRDKHVVSDRGIQSHRPFGPSNFLKWEKIVSVKYVVGFKWFKIRDSSGKSSRLSSLLIGLPHFASMTLNKVPGRYIDSETLGILKETAAGNPPNTWS